LEKEKRKQGKFGKNKDGKKSKKKRGMDCGLLL
jgi:hypothetical protein